jgi:UDP-N-acetylglucosamine diphosphorylase / glucose-1-phosphate thymidylyltransferase / UDP-N-acetylgalactosamine diphosphorylase / glucosamine-1-phosphate N-acetyltransferase / galactosamine-1-phosphate N-acetyltransferase
MEIVLVDKPEVWANLHPITLTRPISDIRLGMFTILEKWQKWLPETKIFQQSCGWLQKEKPCGFDECLHIDSSVFPDESLVQAIKQLRNDEAIYTLGVPVVAYGSLEEKAFKRKTNLPVNKVQYLWDLKILLPLELKMDLQKLCQPALQADSFDGFTHFYNPENVFIEEGVLIRSAVINAENGPVYIGKHSQIHELAVIQGPFLCGEGCHVYPGCRIRGNVALGAGSNVGGELKNVQFQGNSNKIHEGYLGDAFIGEWCNMGSGTTNSNLKNTLGNVKLYNMHAGEFLNSGLQKLGVFMGDYVCTGIHTLIPTGAVYGTMCNIIHQDGFAPKYLPPFSWLSVGQRFNQEKAIQTARSLKALKSAELREEELYVLNEIYKWAT